MLISIYRVRISVYYMGHSKSPADLYRPHHTETETEDKVSMELDRSKFVTPEVAAERAVRSGDWVDYGFGAAFRN
mgnify:CR=1 FL=1